MVLGVYELLYLKKLIKELKLFKEESPSFFCDNKTTISTVQNSVQHDRIKHIEIDRYFIKEKVVDGSLCLYHVSFSNQIVDIFTKGFCNKTFQNFICKLDMCDIFAPT